MHKVLKVFVLVFVFLVFVYKAFVFLDPDFGHQLKTGEYISKTQGVPLIDQFSYTMPSYPVVSHEWLLTLLLALTFPILGFEGLSLVFSGIFLATFLIITRRIRDSVETLLFCLGVAATLPFFGVRFQVFSWMLMVLETLILFGKNYDKTKIFLPVVFLIWTNVHGSFLMGLVGYFVFLLFRSIRRKSFSWSDASVAAFSLFLTFVNPYIGQNWRETWTSFTDTNLRWSIVEWMPAVFSFNLPFMAMIALSGVFLWIYRRKIVLEKKVLYLVFLFQALSSVRHVPLWVVIAIPITIEAINYFIKDLRNIKLGQVRLQKVLKFSVIGGLAIFLLQAFFALRGAESFSEDTFYPREAVYYLKQNGVCGRVFNDYGWGGYLIWKMPEAKVFIDGRMPSWRWNVSVPKEANWAMKEYSGVLSGDMGFERVFDKYGIGTVLVPVDKKESLYSVLVRKIDSILFKKEEPFKLKEELTDKGFKEVYKDNVAVVFKASDCSLRI